MQNLNQAIEILRAQVHEREEEWKRERLEYQVCYLINAEPYCRFAPVAR